MSDNNADSPLEQVLRVCREWRTLKSPSETDKLEHRSRIHRILYDNGIGSGFVAQEPYPDDKFRLPDDDFIFARARDVVDDAIAFDGARTVNTAKNFLGSAAMALACRDKIAHLLSDADLKQVSDALMTLSLNFEKLEREANPVGRRSGVTHATKWLCIEIWMAEQDAGNIAAGIRALTERFPTTGVDLDTLRRVYNRCDPSEYLPDAQATYIALCLIEMDWFHEREVVEELWQSLGPAGRPRARFMPTPPLPPDADDDMRRRWYEYEMRPPASWGLTPIRRAYYAEPVRLARRSSHIWAWVVAIATHKESSDESGAHLLRARLEANRRDPCLMIESLVVRGTGQKLF